MGPLLPEHYDREQSDDKHPLQNFHKFLQASLIRTDNPATTGEEKFVPFELMRDYFREEGRLLDVLSAVFPDEDPIPVEDSVVQEFYLKTFCILLSIGGAVYIRNFVGYESLNDRRLPYHHTSKPPDFPISPSRPNLWDLFREKQWMFCAADMSYKINNYLEPNRILPIIERQVLAEGGSAVVSRIVLHKSFNKLRDEAFLANPASKFRDTFVLKTYHKQEAEAYYHNEVEAFRRLRPPKGSSDPNIIHFYGSYIQNETYNVILDFADQGTLEHYFRKVLPPTSGRDIEHFWASLCGILKALIHIHEVDCQNTANGPRIFEGWHQDVKPDNILVTSNNIDSPYDWKFRLSDLGLSHFKRKRGPEGTDIDAYGTETYGAPECYRADRFLEDSTIKVKQNVDIWSFGCILSEAAVWVVHGYAGLEQYRSGRREAISKIPGISKGGDWFHNGNEVLPVVLKTMDDLEEDFRKSDQVTGSILEKMVKTMLDVPDLRHTAKGLHVQARRILHRPSIIESPVVSSSPGLPPLSSVAAENAGAAIFSSDASRLTQNPQTLSASPSSPQTDQTVAESNHLPACQIGNDSTLHIPVPGVLGANRPSSNASATGSTASANRSPTLIGQPLTPTLSNPRPISTRRLSLRPPNKGSPRTELPYLDVDVAERWIRDKKAGRLRDLPGGYLLKRLETRDHLFLIDDATSMKSHETEVKRILSILAYLVKDSDPDGIELRFTGSRTTVKSKESTKLVEAFGSNKPRGLTNMRPRLSSIIDGYIKDFDKSWVMKKIKPIRSLNIYVLTDGIWQPACDLTPPIGRLIKKLQENGQYQVGIQFISFGNDSDALRRLAYLDDNLGLELDIIDHEPSNRNVWKMLFGATDPWFDGNHDSHAAKASNTVGPPV